MFVSCILLSQLPGKRQVKFYTFKMFPYILRLIIQAEVPKPFLADNKEGMADVGGNEKINRFRMSLHNASGDRRSRVSLIC